MKKIIYTICLALMTFCIGCDDDDNHLPQVKPESTGTLTDDEGNEYTWVRYDGLDWMTSNFKAGTPYYELKDSWGWSDLISISDKDQAIADYDMYGNLYTYEDAIANAPEGWRLPTDEDWKKLEKVLGMSPGELDDTGWRGSVEGELIQQDETGSGIHSLPDMSVYNRELLFFNTYVKSVNTGITGAARLTKATRNQPPCTTGEFVSILHR